MRFVVNSLLLLAVAALLAAPATRFRAAERVRVSLQHSHEAVAADEISGATAAGYGRWLEGSDSSDPFCATAKSSAETTRGKDAPGMTTPGPAFVAVLAMWAWMPKTFGSFEVFPGDVISCGGLLETPPSPPPKA